jgi:hypothetical protein
MKDRNKLQNQNSIESLEKSETFFNVQKKVLNKQDSFWNPSAL